VKIGEKPRAPLRPAPRSEWIASPARPSAEAADTEPIRLTPGSVRRVLTPPKEGAAA